MPVHFSSTCADGQKVKILLHRLWYHHTCRWSSDAQVIQSSLSHCTGQPPIGVMIPEAV